MRLFNKMGHMLEILFRFLPISRNKILFSSFRGQYNDNPKYISEELHRQYPNIKIYWVISEKSKMNDLPSYINVLKYDTIRYFIVKNLCCAIVENGAGDCLFDTSTRLFNLKKHLKNKKQLDFSTWHGNPIKHIGAQIPGNEFWNENSFFTSSDVLIAGCKLVKEIFEQAFLKKMPILLIGTPRNDILYKSNLGLKHALKSKLHLPIDKKIVLYAPTYRDSVESSGIEQIKLIDFEKLFKSLHDRFGGEWVFVYRVHNMVLLDLESLGIIDNFNENIINGNEFDDMAEYLVAADVLISDYSGCIYDVALTNKPCFLFAHDRKQYETKERGLYFPISKFPYTFADNFDQLLLDIENYDDELTEQRRCEFLNFVGNCEDGKAASRAVEYIYENAVKEGRQ